jgi:glycosyltransferase involved in cell wall biosynthesis
MSGSIDSVVIAVVIPCYKVSNELQDVVNAIPENVDLIYCVNDCCPEDSTRSIEIQSETDKRLKVIKRETNGGVGAAVMTGYSQAVEDGADIVVKVDGDGQMDPALIPLFVAEIAEGRADYVKGNRFYSLENAKAMPLGRKVGNIGLSFLTKLSTGYWQLFDPTNGYTAIHTNIIKALPLDYIEQRFFFESDILFHIGLLHARVVDIPMTAFYGEEESNLNDLNALYSFPVKHARNFFKRIFYEYFLRNFSIASLELLVGFLFVFFGVIFGMNAWINTAQTGQTASAGTVMLASLPTILGIQFVLNFFAYDMAREPTIVVHDRLRLYRKDRKN